MENEIQCEVTKSTTVLIRANAPTVELDEPLYAINWFSTKVAWLYHLYNFLASKSVAKVGGKGFFKGEITKTILDEAQVARSFILVVRYPSGYQFKALMQRTYFKLVSLLRLQSVKDFSFGFTQKKIAEESSQVSDGLSYVVHHFKVANLDATLFSTFNTLLLEGVRIKYAGAMVAQLFGQKNKGKPRAIPNHMDGLVIFEADSKTHLDQMLESPGYKTLIENLDSSYIGYIRRTL